MSATPQPDIATPPVSEQAKRQDAASTVEAASSRFIPSKRQDAASTVETHTPLEKYRFFNPYGPLDVHESNLPHWRQKGVTYFVTFRLADSIPQTKLKQWIADKDVWLKKHPEPWILEEKEAYFELFTARMEQWLDSGYGSCLLKDPACAEIVRKAMAHFDGDRYQLGCNTVAANHAHAIITPATSQTLESILHSWKSFTANAINKHLDRSGTVWQKESYDHIIRNPTAAYRIEQYILRHDEPPVETASTRLSS